MKAVHIVSHALVSVLVVAALERGNDAAMWSR